MILLDCVSILAPSVQHDLNYTIIIIIIIFIEGAQLAKAVFSGALMHKSN